MVSYIFTLLVLLLVKLCLNPYCSGRWSRTATVYARSVLDTEVLILIVVEDGLVHVIRNAETGTRVIKS